MEASSCTFEVPPQHPHGPGLVQQPQFPPDNFSDPEPPETPEPPSDSEPPLPPLLSLLLLTLLLALALAFLATATGLLGGELLSEQ